MLTAECSREEVVKKEETRDYLRKQTLFQESSWRNERGEKEGGMGEPGKQMTLEKHLEREEVGL